ncbi:MAG: autotransporter domain-containing protein [Chlamydiales bacterium]|nr:autotransporter domain-containing protein [Chlamydiales bacterium]
MRYRCLLICLLSPFYLAAQVNTNTDPATPVAGTLRYAILNAAPGDTITINLASPNNVITLTGPLPTITQTNLTISAASSSAPVTIDGAGSYHIFSAVQNNDPLENITLQNITLQNGASKGGNGGSGHQGGGGGAGGGGGLYVHTGSHVTLNSIVFNNNQAIGGNGGVAGGNGDRGGGGGGGFGGGNGGNTTGGDSTGGGGGGVAGGRGGDNSALAGAGGRSGFVQSGGGGGGSSTENGGVAYRPQDATLSYSGGTGSGGGGGGAGAGGAGSGANGIGGTGGPGIGIDQLFAGGGGGGASTSTAQNGGAGTGMGGGGGANSGSGNSRAGGAGGSLGGGGGAGSNRNDDSIGGQGGFGGGGGGGKTGGISIFAGGTGEDAVSGGGGAALGGAIYVQNGATLTILNASFSGNTVTPGTGGSPVALALSNDLFIRSGGTVTFQNASPVTITSNIESDEGVGGGTGGGIIMQGTGTLTLGSSDLTTGLNTYTESTQILSGTLQVFQDANLGSSSNSVTIGNGTLQALGSFSSPRSITLSGSAIVNTGLSSTLTLTGIITGAGSLSVTGTGVLALQGVNTYISSTQIVSGTLQIAQDSNLGNSSNNLVIQNGTLQIMPGFASSSRPISLTGAATIDTQANNFTPTGTISGSGSLTKVGTGTLILSPGNTYSGGTNLSAGTISFSANTSLDDSALGALNKQVSLASGTTLIATGTNPIHSTRPFVLQDPAIPPATFDVQASAPFTINGSITGDGALTKTGPGDLVLFGANSYSGGTTITQNRLVGNTSGLQGTITFNNPTTLVFVQAASGTFQGTLVGNGTLQIGDTPAPPSLLPPVIIANANPLFTGPTNILSGGNLKVNGSLANSSLMTISLGGLLTGTGIVGPLTSSGWVEPGNSIGTLTVQGDLTLLPSSNFLVQISPTEASLLQVLGNAALDGTVTVLPLFPSGFYGIGNSYTILTNTGVQSGTFAPIPPSPNLEATLSYFPHSVILNIKVEKPFLNFPYENPNEQSVGENINALSAAGDIPAGSPLAQAINSLIGLSNSQIDRALDQMHPAPFSAFAEIQAALGGQLLSMFHRRPAPGCACFNGSRLWLEPYGNWLKEKNVGYQVGFNAISKGVAGGIDTETEDGLIFGLGAGWNDTEMQWRRGQGHSTIRGWFGGAYIDYTSDNFYLGLSGLGAYDSCESSRHIQFSTVNERASAKRHNVEMMGQFASAVFFGPDSCFAFPYFNLDYFYLREGSAQESGAPGLNLSVSRHSSSTLRSEAGFAVQVQDMNKANTMCVSPLFGLGWAMELPLQRPKYKASFEGEPIPFYTQGWDYTWQLFTLRFGFSITYRCLSIWGGYTAEMSPLERTPFFDQRGDIRLEYSW